MLSRQCTLVSGDPYIFISKMPWAADTVFDLNPVDWDEQQFEKYDWKDFYGDVKESIPPNAPVPRGIPVQINVFVADNAGDKITRKSQTGILMYE
jgi:hypothetical protein